MANKRIKDLTERTTLAAGDYLATDNDNGTRKVNASKILTPISTAQSTANNVATKVSNSGDAFSSSKGYSVGELCIYNNTLYRCKTAYSTGASWASRSSNFEAVTLAKAVSALNNDLSGDLIKIEQISATPAANSGVTPFTHYATASIPVKTGYTLVSVQPRETSSGRMLVNINAAKTTAYLFCMNNTAVICDCIYVKNSVV